MLYIVGGNLDVVKRDGKIALYTRNKNLVAMWDLGEEYLDEDKYGPCIGHLGSTRWEKSLSIEMRDGIPHVVKKIVWCGYIILIGDAIGNIEDKHIIYRGNDFAIVPLMAGTTGYVYAVNGIYTNYFAVIGIECYNDINRASIQNFFSSHGLCMDDYDSKVSLERRRL